MYRCKSCGWIHDGESPPDVCVSCGATADRFRPMDEAEVDAITGLGRTDGRLFDADPRTHEES